MKFLRTISVFALVLLVLVSTSSFMVGIHYCSGDVQDIELFTKADGCEMEKSLPPCHRHLKAPCCEDETVLHKGENIKAHVIKVHLATPGAIDIDLPFTLISEIIPSTSFSGKKFFNYDPPLRSCDFTVAHQVFLI